MANRKIFALALCLTVSGACITGAYAQITVSGGFAVSSINDAKITGYMGHYPSYGPSIENSKPGLGGSLSADWLLPGSIPLSLGFEAGFDSASFEIIEEVFTHGFFNDTVTAIPLLLRAAWHFDIVPKLDLYLVGKIGYVIGIMEGDFKNHVENEKDGKVESVGGVGFGFDVGVAYYLNPKMGIFVEAGFDSYVFETKYSPGNVPFQNLFYETKTVTVATPFYRFFTAGVSVKF
jgi:hypothetical protein